MFESRSSPKIVFEKSLRTSPFDKIVAQKSFQHIFEHRYPEGRFIYLSFVFLLYSSMVIKNHRQKLRV